MVISIGTDLVQIQRFRAVVNRRGRPFLDRLFTLSELAACEKRGLPDVHLAARFAAKEAVFKALGTGLSLGMRWQDVEVVGGNRKAPGVYLSGLAKARAEALGVKTVLLSLSHDGQYALAFVVATD